MAEIELKLEVEPALAEAGRRRIEAEFGPGKPRKLDSVYFDTDNHRLKEAGLTLRVRKIGRRRVQTIKADSGGQAGLFNRDEWERPIATDHPDAASLAGTPLEGLNEPLQPIFRTAVTRTVWNGKRDAARFEIAFDEGAIEAVETQEPLCEIELELNGGTPAALFDWARLLDAEVPLRIGARSKSERGYALLGKGAAAVAKAEPVKLIPGITAADTFATIARSCIRHFRLNEPIVLALRDARALHQSRVAMRRLRSAFSLFKPLLEADPETERLKGELRWLSSVLGEARNLDVLLGRLDDAELRAGLETRREPVYGRVIEALQSQRCRSLMLDLARWIELGAWREPADRELADMLALRYARGVLDRRQSKIVKRGKSLEALPPEERHELRIAAKKLRYATEFFASFVEDSAKAKRRRSRFLDALETIQTHLGNLNDVETAGALIDSAPMTPKDHAPVDRLLDLDPRRELIRAQAGVDMIADIKRFWR